MISLYNLSKKSKEKLKQVHPDLQAVVSHAIEITDTDFCVLEGMRTPERQKELYDQGATTILRSRHLTGHAVDLGAWVDKRVQWHWPLYHRIARAMKKAAKELKIPIEWGGDWKRPDGPHFQLPRKQYPAKGG